MTREGLCRRPAIWLLLALLAGAGAAAADDEEGRNRVSFTVAQVRDVENDWVSAVVGVTHEDEDPAQLAERVNRDMSWALGVAKAKSGLRVRSGGYRTVPIQDPKKAKLRRWRASQDLVVEGPDAGAVSDLLGELQERLQIQSIVFSVSPKRRQAVEDELTDEAIDAFRARAERLRRKLGAKAYQLVHLRVDVSGGQPVPLHRGVRAMGMAEAAVVTPPALEGGTSRLGAHLTATIEVEF
jgi:predicted secreted protein